MAVKDGSGPWPTAHSAKRCFLNCLETSFEPSICLTSCPTSFQNCLLRLAGLNGHLLLVISPLSAPPAASGVGGYFADKATVVLLQLLYTLRGAWRHGTKLKIGCCRDDKQLFNETIKMWVESGETLTS